MAGPRDGSGNQIDCRRHAGRQLDNAAIERREAPALTHGKRKKMRIRHLPIADDPFERRRVGIDGGHVVVPEGVSR